MNTSTSPIILNATINEAFVTTEREFIVAVVKYQYGVVNHSVLHIPFGEKGKKGAFKSVKYGLSNMDAMMRFAESATWEGMVGKHVRVEVKDDRIGSPAIKIGHITKDEWLNVGSIE